MNSVHVLRNRNVDIGSAQPALNLQSPIMFQAYERPLWYEGRDLQRYSNTAHKALVRVIDEQPVCLNVVRNTYRVVQNAELFDAIDEGLLAGITPSERRSAVVKDKTSYMGAVCLREYIFPEISVDSPENDRIVFRIIVQNGFGTGSIKMYGGAIDFFCTNGLIRGEYTSTYAKHTKGVQISKFREAVAASVRMFWKDKDFFNELAGKRVLSDLSVSQWYNTKFGELLGRRLYAQYIREVQTRGRTLWAVYSALTYYCSHANGDFAMRQTKNDHAASTMIKREQDVRKAISDEAFHGLAA